ncbi:uncharacterized protein [Anas platyrhynchos]|uniref:uncharacterized protein n=1 Tax=Anas platyrhynchos TaxID=8839 RepID=UPI003AF25E92
MSEHPGKLSREDSETEWPGQHAGGTDAHGRGSSYPGTVSMSAAQQRQHCLNHAWMFTLLREVLQSSEMIGAPALSYGELTVLSCMEIRMSLRLLYFTEWRQNPADFPHLPQTYWLTSSSSSSLPVAVPLGTSCCMSLPNAAWKSHSPLSKS